jgi:Tfp pilus assembly protein PilV
MKMALNNFAASRRAFSLLEVMIAVGVFFMAVFAILGLVSSSLENARRLQRPMVDASMIASELSLTNKLTEGEMSGDFGELYPGYTWTGKVTEEQTNRIFRVEYIVQRSDGNRAVMSQMSILLFRPQSDAGTLDGATK